MNEEEFPMQEIEVEAHRSGFLISEVSDLIQLLSQIVPFPGRSRLLSASRRVHSQPWCPTFMEQFKISDNACEWVHKGSISIPSCPHSSLKINKLLQVRMLVMEQECLISSTLSARPTVSMLHWFKEMNIKNRVHSCGMQLFTMLPSMSNHLFSFAGIPNGIQQRKSLAHPFWLPASLLTLCRFGKWCALQAGDQNLWSWFFLFFLTESAVLALAENSCTVPFCCCVIPLVYCCSIWAPAYHANLSFDANADVCMWNKSAEAMLLYCVCCLYSLLLNLLFMLSFHREFHLNPQGFVAVSLRPSSFKLPSHWKRSNCAPFETTQKWTNTRQWKCIAGFVGFESMILDSLCTTQHVR